jgi:hypothetical protein
MKTLDHGNSVAIWLSARDTQEWARRPGDAWPCSALAGRRVFASFDSNGLNDLSIDGGRGEQDIDGNELSAICADFLERKIGPEHSCYFVTVGQFK